MKNKIINGILTAIMLFAVLAYGETPYEIKGFNESLSEQVDVSGGFLIGFQLEGEAKKPNLSNLYVSRPNDISNFNLRLSSIDGVYSAEMEVNFSSWDGAWTQISIPSEHQKELSKYTKQELVAYAYRELDDPKSKRRKFHQVFPTSWGAPLKEAEFNDGKLFINSAANNSKYATKEDQVYCKDLEFPVKTAFNRTCDASKLKQGENLVVMTAGRRKKYLIWIP